MSHFLKTNINLPSIFSFVGGNPVAAIPSLHAALPTMVFLFLFKWNKKAGIAFIPYLLGVYFAVVYLGEHYVVDVIIGALYSIIVFFTVQKLSKKLPSP